MAIPTLSRFAKMALELISGDLASPTNGTIWYNNTTGRFRKRENGVTTDLAPNVTVGTTAPSSPAVGDIWIDTN